VINRRESPSFAFSVVVPVGLANHCIGPYRSGGSAPGPGRGHRPPNLAGPPNCVLGPKFNRTLDTLWSVDFLEKLVNLMPSDVRF